MGGEARALTNRPGELRARARCQRSRVARMVGVRECDPGDLPEALEVCLVVLRERERIEHHIAFAAHPESCSSCVGAKTPESAAISPHHRSQAWLVHGGQRCNSGATAARLLGALLETRPAPRVVHQLARGPWYQSGLATDPTPGCTRSHALRDASRFGRVPGEVRVRLFVV